MFRICLLDNFPVMKENRFYISSRSGSLAALEEKVGNDMKHIKRIIAWIGIILLVALYVSTLVLALSNHPNAMDMFMTAVIMTIVVPVIIWFYTFVYERYQQRKADMAADIPPANEDTPGEHDKCSK